MREISEERVDQFVALGQRAALIYCKKAEKLAGISYHGLNRFRKPRELPEITQENVVKWVISVRHTLNTRHRKLHTHASAYGKKNEIRYNPIYLASLPDAEFERRILDLILHEMGHLFTWHFLGTMFHDYDWQIIGCTVGYAPVGSTSERNRDHYIRAVAHAQEISDD